MRVLILDDECFLAELVKLALEADGHGCVTAPSVEEASEILRTVRIDLLTLDLVEGGRDPLDWLEEVALAQPELHGRVFVLTGRDLTPHETMRIGGCGARVIQKPFTLHGLREAVTALERAEAGPGIARGADRVSLRAERPGRPIPEDS